MELIEANSQYAHVRLPNGKESTVALRHLAPVGNERLSENDSLSENPANPSHAPSPSPPSPNPSLPIPSPQNSEDTDNVSEPIESESTDTENLDESFENTCVKDTLSKTPFIRTSSYNLRSGHK